MGPALVQVGVQPDPEFSVAGADDEAVLIDLVKVVVFAGPRKDLKKHCSYKKVSHQINLNKFIKVFAYSLKVKGLGNNSAEVVDFIPYRSHCFLYYFEILMLTI